MEAGWNLARITGDKRLLCPGTTRPFLLSLIEVLDDQKHIRRCKLLVIF